jgi:hypothetical protein
MGKTAKFIKYFGCQNLKDREHLGEFKAHVKIILNRIKEIKYESVN